MNLGCPQGIAKRGCYGSFLLEDVDLVLKIAGYLSNNLKCAFTCKIRLFPDIEKSIWLAKQLEVNNSINNLGKRSKSFSRTWEN